MIWCNMMKISSHVFLNLFTLVIVPIFKEQNSKGFDLCFVIVHRRILLPAAPLGYSAALIVKISGIFLHLLPSYIWEVKWHLEFKTILGRKSQKGGLCNISLKSAFTAVVNLRRSLCKKPMYQFPTWKAFDLGTGWWVKSISLLQ